MRFYPASLEVGKCNWTCQPFLFLQYKTKQNNLNYQLSEVGKNRSKLTQAEKIERLKQENSFIKLINHYFPT